MECFSGFWTARPTEEEGAAHNIPWYIGGIYPRKVLPPPQTISNENYPFNGISYEDINDLKPPHDGYKYELHTSRLIISQDMSNDENSKIISAEIQENSTGCCITDTHSSENIYEVTRDVTNQIKSSRCSCSPRKVNKCMDLYLQRVAMATTTIVDAKGEDLAETAIGRQRRTGVYEIGDELESKHSIFFKSVKKLTDNCLELLQKTTKTIHMSSSNITSDTKKLLNDFNKDSDDIHLLPPPSGYCSSTASGASDDERCYEKVQVRRSASSDSAIVPSDEDSPVLNSNWCDVKKDANEETALNFQYSPYSPRGSIDHENVPSKTLIEAHYVPFPIDRKFSDSVSESTDFEAFNINNNNSDDSRRQSCYTDDGEEITRYRYWRTPSVVVSDYSDDIMGLTLEDIEYIRNQRNQNSSSPDSSLHSSCSNLNFCASTVHSLEPFRKISDCSTCSTFSGDEEDSDLTSKNKEPSPWRKVRNFVQWTPFFQTYKKHRYPWVQLAGHQGNFKAGPDQGTILKKLCVKEEKCFKVLMNDVLRPYVPEYKGLVKCDDGDNSYIQLQDLLGDFVSPCVMDCKIGVRTYLEEELAKAKEKPKLRKDMYEKMCLIDSEAPTEDEHKMKGVTKPRYMVWRETISSTATLGFRIEGIRKSDGTSSKDFKTTKTKEQVVKEFQDFTENFPHAVPKYIQRLKAIKATLQESKFFNSHEVIGSSLLFVHDRYNANVWLIDFAKTVQLPGEVSITHNAKWKVGNHEDGYLIGVDNIISIFKTMLENLPVPISPPLSLPDVPEVTRSQPEKNENT